MMTIEQLQHLRENLPARDDCVEIKTVHIDPELPVCERATDYLLQVKNPYRFRVGEIIVNLQFAGERSLKEAVMSYLVNLKNLG